MLGASQLHSRKQYYQTLHDDYDTIYKDDIYNEKEEEKERIMGRLSHFLFGFLYEENDDDDDDDLDEQDRLYRSRMESSTPLYNSLNLALAGAIATTAAAESAPLTLMAAISDQFSDLASLASHTAAAAVFGAAIGKFINGPLIDLMGARRIFVGSSLFLCASLVFLAVSQNTTMVIAACFLIEFTSTVQWPSIIVILATHYRGNQHGMYEGGVFVTSLGSRMGALLAIPVYSYLLPHWRFVALSGGWLALVSCSIVYLYVQDAPHQLHAPQNPIDPWRKDRPTWTIVRHVLQENIVPSVRHICASPTFWWVALAHAGSATVRSSERVLATYFYETGTKEEESAGLAVYLSIGITAGLIVAGNAFASQSERERKQLVSRLYLASIVACYALAAMAIPAVHRIAPDLMRIFQIMAVVVAGFGIAVPLYHIPSLVGATFGCDKGMYAAYTDGVGYGLSSIVWGVIVGGSLQGHHGDGVGWAYGWAAVALLLILSSILMIEFMEYYFCRPRNGGTYETIIFA
jgi:MFS family permease